MSIIFWLFVIITSLLHSNACVGGSATAATMASSFGRKDLIVSASGVGVVGYLLGTQIGLAVSKILSKI